MSRKTSDKLEQWIEDYLESRPGGQRQNPNAPSSWDLYRYLNDELEGAELERVLAFLKDNAEGQDLVTRARELMQSEGGWENEAVPSESVKKVKALMRGGKKTSCPHCGGPITPFKKPLKAQAWAVAGWLILATAAFVLSFFVRRYFMQFLAAAVLAGVKAIVELRAAKTQILIYKALSDTTGGTEHRLHHHSTRL